jgi:hypothetical protein
MQQQTPASSIGRPKGGRPRKNYDHLIGATRNYLLINAIYRANNELFAAATCTRCGTLHDCRLRDVLSGHTKSCKCLRPHQYLVNIATLADRIPEHRLADMWAEHFAGAGRWAIATANRLAVEVVDFALRRYQRILDRIIGTGHALRTAARAVPAKVAEYLKKAEIRVQNVLSRARAAEAASEKAGKAWEWTMRRWMREESAKYKPLHPDAVVEFV